jgi:bifunctional non-homologous end joining protein LigD
MPSRRSFIHETIFNSRYSKLSPFNAPIASRPGPEFFSKHPQKRLLANEVCTVRREKRRAPALKPVAEPDPGIFSARCLRVKEDVYISLDGEILKLTRPDKILFPEAGFRKRDVIAYYRAVAPAILPHLRDRPLTLKRYPSGVGGDYFHEKNCPSHRPRWVRTGVFEGISYCLINDLKTLVWVANLASIELHTTLARIENMRRPSWIAFDLDPGEGTGIRECGEVALLLRDFLAKQGLAVFAKTSGQKGLHVYLPLNVGATYEQATGFARFCAEVLEFRHPDLVTSKMNKKLRNGKILVDWSQNVDFKSTVCVYSLRATQLPGVSTPLKWSEVRAAEKLHAFDPDEAIWRIKRWGDLFGPVLELRQALPERAARAA